MARRSSNSGCASGCLTVVVLCMVIGGASSAWEAIAPAYRVHVVFGGVGALVLLLLAGVLHRAHRIDSANRTVISADSAIQRVNFSISKFDSEPFVHWAHRIIDHHARTLAFKRRQKWVADEYGVIDPGPWDREVERFVNTVLIPQMASATQERRVKRSVEKIVARVQRKAPSFEANQIVYAVLRGLVNRRVAGVAASTSVDAAAISPGSAPAEFERWCAGELTRLGWNSRVTLASGDQGVDVIATRAGITAVFQCKLYTQPVGNSAVQEVYAGMAFYRADVAAVVSSSGYTQSARAVAAQTGVHLLKPDDLAGFLA